MKNGTNQKRVADPDEIVRLARKTEWREVKFATGDVVTAETTRQIFEDAGKALKSKSRRKRAHVTVA